MSLLRSKLFLGSIVAMLWVAVFVLENKLSRARRTLALQESECAESKKRESNLRQSFLNAERVLADLYGNLAGQGKSAAQKSSQPPKRVLRPFSELMKDPRLQVFSLASSRSVSRRHFAALYQQLHLNSVQIEAFEQLLARQAEGRLDATALAHDDSKQYSVGQMAEEVEKNFTMGIQTLLGPAGYERFQEYERLGEARDLVNAYGGGAVAVVGAPFTPDQGEQLVQVIANASPSYLGGGSVRDSDIDWPTVEAKAATFLSADQLNLIENMEPPLPSGGRYQTQLYRQVEQAKQQERSAAGKN